MRKLVKDTLTPAGVPVEFMKYSGTATTYITFFFYNEQGEDWAENEETATGYSLQVDIWSLSDYTVLEGQVKSLMQAAGFIRTAAIDLYESDTKVYHRAIRFNFTN